MALVSKTSGYPFHPSLPTAKANDDETETSRRRVEPLSLATSHQKAYPYLIGPPALRPAGSLSQHRDTVGTPLGRHYVGRHPVANAIANSIRGIPQFHNPLRAPGRTERDRGGGQGRKNLESPMAGSRGTSRLVEFSCVS